TRLRDMGVEPFLLSSSLIGVLAQRLVRVLCDDCKEAYTAGPADCRMLGVAADDPPTLYHARGCNVCNQLGYRGRTGIYELIEVSDTMRGMIHDGEGEQTIERLAREDSPSMRQDGWRKALEGVTSVEEVLRVTQGE
ncbi:MAG: type II secretion system protein GspE, partial [Gammaproteobacteria bacterium]|nr:type II secretion system protein GspE [Gammaproteobacteria bacterium]